jgi:hypothetical protein
MGSSSMTCDEASTHTWHGYFWFTVRIVHLGRECGGVSWLVRPILSAGSLSRYRPECLRDWIARGLFQFQATLDLYRDNPPKGVNRQMVRLTKKSDRSGHH